MSEEKPNQGASRPTGKRQLAGVSTTSSSSYQARHAAPVEPEEKKPNPVISFLPQVIDEMKKVIWPTARQMVTYTVIVFTFLILMTALVSGIDFLAGLGVEKVLSR